jgi:hypothetical protein
MLKYEKLPREKLNGSYVTQNYNSPNGELDKDTLDIVINWLSRQVKS